MSSFILSDRTYDKKRRKLGQKPSIRGCKLYKTSDSHIEPVIFSTVIDDVKDSHLVIFIHGYNVSVSTAIEDSNNIESKLNELLPNNTILVIPYCWPSNGKLSDYMSDEKDAEDAGYHFGTFLNSILSKTKECVFRSITVVTHSMGSRVLRSCCSKLIATNLVPFNEVLLVAADIASNKLEYGHTGGNLPFVCKRLTVYYNHDDFALAASSIKHINNRLGRVGLSDITSTIPNVYQVDCTHAFYNTKDGTSHSFYFFSDKVMEDISALISGIECKHRKQVGVRTYEIR